MDDDEFVSDAQAADDEAWWRNFWAAIPPEKRAEIVAEELSSDLVWPRYARMLMEE
ncbi:hypothetical protein [Marinactinospora rubrisoli]|uniref:Uncharacterized protein n=1 Tax=Marinactinospora rubrisoli TaxID=2715399 RepID=A0ABW2KDP4_9ACTN